MSFPNTNHILTPEHTTVLLADAVTALAVKSGGHYVDATFGRGGHSRLILSKLENTGQLTVFDKDPQAIATAQAMKSARSNAGADEARFDIRHQGFVHLDELSTASVDGLLFDLGVSSPQLDDPKRGFSFRQDGPLDMRMNTTQGITVAQWLETASIAKLVEVIRDYGEERFAPSIAKAIDRYRQAHGPIRTTSELAQIVAGAVKTREPGKNPATRTFQAFRIYINRELEELVQALEASLRILRPGGRLVVISFHSLEDRMVKQFMARHARETVDRRQPFATSTPLHLRIVERVMPSVDEIARNPRARSAVMRVAERTNLACLD